MKAEVEKLIMSEPEWGHFFQMCCSDGVERLEGQVWQFRDELADYGQRHRLDDVQDALFDLARELVPESLAAGKAAYEDWAGSLLRQMFDLLHERGLEGPAGVDADRIDEAYATYTRATLRAVVRDYARKAIENQKEAA